MKLPRTFDESMELLEHMTKVLIEKQPHQKKLLKKKLKEMKKELIQTHRVNVRFVPMEINDYAFFAKLPENEMLVEYKMVETLKQLFIDGQLSFEKKDGEESVVQVKTPILTEFAVFEGEVLPVRELMGLVGLSNARGEV